jgi:ectoine hydroxylase-related dioxygenase (phytanoyl-CoA dioxygenase family)
MAWDNPLPARPAHLSGRELVDGAAGAKFPRPDSAANYPSSTVTALSSLSRVTSIDGQLRDRFEGDGYVICDVLTEDEIARFLAVVGELLDVDVRAEDERVHSASYQHFGDELSQFGRESRQYYFHLLTTPGTEAVHSAFYNPVVLGIVEELLGPKPIVNNASMLAFNPGAAYAQGWHRDVIQIPEDEIEDRLFSPEWHHNSVQINLPLLDEQCLWVVPGSHRRPNSAEEDRVFAGSKHYSPVGVEMPGAVPVALRAGQAVFYNNNLIHRGYSADTTASRRTLHMGYHSASRPPTWHFYLLDAGRLTDDYLARLDPTMRGMMEDYLACRAEYPEMAATWQPGFAD